MSEKTSFVLQIWRQRARIYNARLSQELGIAPGPLDVQSLAATHSLAGLGRLTIVSHVILSFDGDYAICMHIQTNICILSGSCRGLVVFFGR